MISLLYNINSLLYALFILPMRFMYGCTCQALSFFLYPIQNYLPAMMRFKVNKRLRIDMYYFAVIVISTILFQLTSDTSSIYHWIKGKSFVKLYSFYVILEVYDILNRSIGKDLLYSLARNVHYGEYSFGVAICL